MTWYVITKYGIAWQENGMTWHDMVMGMAGPTSTMAVCAGVQVVCDWSSPRTPCTQAHPHPAGQNITNKLL